LYTADDFRTFVNKFTWIFARTYANRAPHEYLTLSKVGLEHQPEFIKAAQFIREAGFKAFYYSQPNFYYILDDHYYWTMDDPVEDTDLINRAKLSDYELINGHWQWKGQKQG
jgi:hypothetical protein